MKHVAHMLVGCVLPFLLIFTLPLLGVGEGVTMLAFVILMFACHLFMMHGLTRGPATHRGHEREKEDHAHS